MIYFQKCHYHYYLYSPTDLQKNFKGAIYIEEAITPTCFRKYQDIAVQLKFLFTYLLFQFLFADMTET